MRRPPVDVEADSAAHPLMDMGAELALEAVELELAAEAMATPAVITADAAMAAGLVATRVPARLAVGMDTEAAAVPFVVRHTMAATVVDVHRCTAATVCLPAITQCLAMALAAMALAAAELVVTE